MRIAVAGAYGVGRTYRIERFPAPGETLTATASEDMHGGKGSNQAVAAARLGAHVMLFSAVGVDPAATAARALWDAEGVDHSAVLTRPGATMNGVILVESSGENRIVISPGALARLSPDDVEAFRPAIASADLLIVSLEIPLDVACRALAIAREEGVRTLLNPAPATEMSAEQLAGIDFVTPNQSETELLARGGDETDSIENLRVLTKATIIQTRGGDGALVVASDGTRTVVPAVVPDRVVDTTGAGDAFSAALGVAIVAGLSVIEAATWAAAAGSHATRSHGVISALPYRDNLPLLGNEGAHIGEDIL